jgi:hypothetical protein
MAIASSEPQHQPPSLPGGTGQRFHRNLAAVLIMVHAALVAWPAWRWSPTVDEVAHLPAGVSHWKFRRFELYRVNPPLIRMIAAAPLLGADPQIDWSAFSEQPYDRPEFSIGPAFVRSNGQRIFWYFTWARWACLPVSVLGAWACYRWGKECYGAVPGLLSLALYTFCPNLIGNAALITPDAGAAAFGVLAGYCFWRWLRHPNVLTMGLAGVSLGLAELTKTTWIILFGLWPLLTLLWTLTAPAAPTTEPNSPSETPEEPTPPRYSLRGVQLCGMLVLGLYLLNLGFGFEKSFQRLDHFHFISRTLGGANAHTTPGNRFAGTALGELPVPVPANYVAGIDVQRYDFERKKWSYLCGEHKLGGWWYYYLYALGVKVPLGTIVLGCLAVISTGLRCRLLGWRTLRDDLIILLPALTVLALVSSQTGFSRYMRYVLPMLPFAYVWIGQVGRWFELRHHSAIIHRTWQRGFAAASGVALVAAVCSSLAIWPHSLSYFNEIVGGPKHGPRHLLDANIDWGQDLIYFKEWVADHTEARPLFLSYFGFFDPKTAGLDYPPAPGQPVARESGTIPNVGMPEPIAGWYAVSVNELYGYKHLGAESDRYAYLRQMQPVARCGYSILIFHLAPDDANRLRSEWGLSAQISDDVP